MSQPPEGPEYYAPPPQAPVPIPPPPSISDAAAQYSVAQASDGTYQYVQNPAYNRRPVPTGGGTSQGLAVGALVLGLIAFVTGWIPVWGILVGVIAVILGSVALGKKQSKGMAITGIITGFLGAVASGVVLVVLMAGANWFSDPENWFTYGPTPDSSYYYGNSTTLGPDSGGTSLAVVEQAFGQSTSNPEVWWYAVVLENPNDTIFAYSDITVQALAADGTVLDDSWTYRDIAPGKTALVGNFWETNGETVASLAVVGPPADALSTLVDEGALELSELSVESTEWSTSVSGTVTSGYDEMKYGAVIAIVARDESGTIIGAANGYVGELQPGATEKFDAYFYDLVPEGATFEAFAAPY